MTFDLSTVDPGYASLRSSWVRSLKAQGKSPRTIDSYKLSVDQFTAWCTDSDRPTHPVDQQRGDVEDFIAYKIATTSSGTAGVRYRSLKQWFKWLVDEDEADDATAGMKHPTLDEKRPAVISDDDLRALLETCGSREILDRRDAALLRILIDTGMRRGELVGLRLADVDLDSNVLIIEKSKTRRGRLVPIGSKAVRALDRYLRARPRHRDAVRPELWLGIHGPLTGEGVRQMVMSRCRRAGIAPVNVHQFRHTAAHRWLLAGGQEGDLAAIAGWTQGSPMLARYGASAAGERARQAHPTAKADLFRCRFAHSGELPPGAKLDEAQVKELTGGDRIKARRMREDHWEFDPSHLLWIHANHRPTIEGTDDGIWRRVLLIPFDVQISPAEQDPHLADRIVNDEGPGVLQWLLDGLADYQTNGLRVPDVISSATTMYRTESDTVARFIAESAISFDPATSISSTELLAIHHEWFAASGSRESENANWQRVTTALKERGVLNKRTSSRGRFWQGIGSEDTGGDAG